MRNQTTALRSCPHSVEAACVHTSHWHENNSAQAEMPSRKHHWVVHRTVPACHRRTGGELQRGGRKCRRRPQRILWIFWGRALILAECRTAMACLSHYLPREQLAVDHSNSQLTSQERPLLRQTSVEVSMRMTLSVSTEIHRTYRIVTGLVTRSFADDPLNGQFGLAGRRRPDNLRRAGLYSRIHRRWPYIPNFVCVTAFLSSSF